LEETVDGKGTFHATQMVAFQKKPCFVQQEPVPLIIGREKTLISLPQLHELQSAPSTKNRQEPLFHASNNANVAQCTIDDFKEAATADRVWSWVPKEDQVSIDNILTRAARVIQRKRTATLDDVTYAATSILSFNLFCTYRSLLTVHYILSSNDCDLYLPALLGGASNTSQRVTRSTCARKFQIPAHSQTAFEHSFYYSAAMTWNAAPNEMTSITSRSSFVSSTLKYTLSKLRT
jgi:hypothetical protein